MFTVTGFTLEDVDLERIYTDAQQGRLRRLSNKEQCVLASRSISMAHARKLEHTTLPRELLAPLSGYGRLPIRFFYTDANAYLKPEANMWLNLYENKFMGLLFKDTSDWTEKKFSSAFEIYRELLATLGSPEYFVNTDDHSELIGYIMFLLKKYRNKSFTSHDSAKYGIRNIAKLIQPIVNPRLLCVLKLAIDELEIPASHYEEYYRFRNTAQTTALYKTKEEVEQELQAKCEQGVITRNQYFIFIKFIELGFIRTKK